MKGFLTLFVLLTGLGALVLFQYPSLASNEPLLKQGKDLMEAMPSDEDADYPSAYFAGGCFWCLESEFRGMDGILFTRVGYMGGDVQDVTYQQVTTGKTGHAEVVEVTYDPAIIDYTGLAQFFLRKAHDPTTLNRQGVDVGTQYRSAIFYGSEEEKQIAEKLIKEIDTEGLYSNPIVTQVVPAATFWLGEEYHQQYYEKYRAKTGKDHIRVILKH